MVADFYQWLVWAFGWFLWIGLSIYSLQQLVELFGLAPVNRAARRRSIQDFGVAGAIAQYASFPALLGALIFTTVTSVSRLHLIWVFLVLQVLVSFIKQVFAKPMWAPRAAVGVGAPPAITSVTLDSTEAEEIVRGYGRCGNTIQALDAVRQCIDAYEARLRSDPDDVKAVCGLSVALSTLVILISKTRPPSTPLLRFQRDVEMSQSVRRSEQIHEWLCENDPSGVLYKLEHVELLVAINYMVRAKPLVEEVLAQVPDDSRALHLKRVIEDDLCPNPVAHSTVDGIFDAPSPDRREQEIFSYSPTSRGEYSTTNNSTTDNSTEDLDCTLFAPPECAVGATIMVQVFVHHPTFAAQVSSEAKEFDEDAQRRGRTSLATVVSLGTRLTIELSIPAVRIDEPAQHLVWRGRSDAVQFEATLPEDLPAGTRVGKAVISQDTVPIGQLRFKITVVDSKHKACRNEAEPASEAVRYRVAFVSYASKDRSEVLRRVQMLPMVGIQYFQDVIDLAPGDRWAQKLYERINDSDVMFLFWSSAARDSEWVEREWRYALEQKGEDFVRPIIIEGPPIIAPPPELSHLHFSDKILYFVKADEHVP